MVRGGHSEDKRTGGLEDRRHGRGWRGGPGDLVMIQVRSVGRGSWKDWGAGYERFEGIRQGNSERFASGKMGGGWMGGEIERLGVRSMGLGKCMGRLEGEKTGG